jgi:hypothetical protein
MSECSFKIEHYLDTLDAYREAGYRLLDFAEYFDNFMDLPEKCLVLRHDVDFGLDRACDISFAERGLGVHSTFFVRLHSRHYNALSYDSIYALTAMHEYGATFGWHAEPDIMTILRKRDNLDWWHWTTRSLDMLDFVLPSRACAISLHCVTKSSSDPTHVNEVVAKTDLPIVSHHMIGLKYLSDSNGRWREGCFCQWIDREPRLHVLTHPVWWFNESPQENY